jgi:SAM-dependent methyltransferase
MHSKLIHLKLCGFDLKLRVGQDAFIPNLTTHMLAEQLHITPDTTVLDLGCGVGPIAIFAAKKGARKVYAVDIMPTACEYARINAELNGVSDRVEVINGDLFAPLQGKKFDIIIDDVSGMAEGVSRLSPWYPPIIPTGGHDGTGPTIRMIREAKNYLTEKGRLYFPVLSLANSRKILEVARETYGDRLKKIGEKLVPFCPDFRTSIAEMEKMKEEGLIDYVTRRSRYLWMLDVYEVAPSNA